MARQPAVSGRFYPADASQLRAAVEQHLDRAGRQIEALGALCPHAGYPFSGAVGGQTIGSTAVPDTVLLLTPSHSYGRPPLALWTDGPWLTPLGEVALNRELTDALAGLAEVTEDDAPHRPEHSGEVILPFLQCANPKVRIAVVCVTQSAGPEALMRFGSRCAEVLGEHAPGALVVASSDMSHESGRAALQTVSENDALAIEQMKALDPEGLYEVVRDEGITMCGVLPAVAMMASVRARGGSQGQLISRATSADSPMGGGDYVVGYAGMLFW